MKWVRRTAWLITGIVWFFWLGYEDRGLGPVIAVAALFTFSLSLEGLARWTRKRPTKPAIWLLRSILIGALAGAFVSPMTILLALVKISFHLPSTSGSDLSNLRVLVGQSLNWIVAGALFGAAGGFLKLSLKR